MGERHNGNGNEAAMLKYAGKLRSESKIFNVLDMAKNGCTILMSNKLPSLVKVWNARGQVIETCVEMCMCHARLTLPT